MKQQQYWVGTQKVKQETEAITRVDDYSILLTFVTVTCHSVHVHCARRLDWSRSKFPPWWLQYDESINLIWSRVLFWSKLRVFKWRHWVPAKRQNKEKKNSPIWKIPFHTTPRSKHRRKRKSQGRHISLWCRPSLLLYRWYLPKLCWKSRRSFGNRCRIRQWRYYLLQNNDLSTAIPECLQECNLL